MSLFQGNEGGNAGCLVRLEDAWLGILRRLEIWGAWGSMGRLPLLHLEEYLISIRGELADLAV